MFTTEDYIIDGVGAAKRHTRNTTRKHGSTGADHTYEPRENIAAVATMKRSGELHETLPGGRLPKATGRPRIKYNFANTTAWRNYYNEHTVNRHTINIRIAYIFTTKYIGGTFCGYNKKSQVENKFRSSHSNNILQLFKFMDPAGAQHLHIEHNIYKGRMDLDGNPKEEAKKEEIITSTTKRENITDVDDVKCGSCYGAAQNDTQCCNTCQDIIDAYREKKWNPVLESFEQCRKERLLGKGDELLALKEGCQIYGYLEVNRMGGSFHVAPGKSFSLNHIHVHDVHPYSSSTFNLSHSIKHLSFGERINYANTHPLDDMDIYAKEGAMMFQYYIKIVPTMYEKLNGEIVNTNQFSVTRHSKSVSVVSGESGMPGIFFSYELSPLMVKYTERENSFGHFATNMCAIVGGIFTVAGIIDSIFHNSLHLIKKKIELGKLS